MRNLINFVIIRSFLNTLISIGRLREIHKNLANIFKDIPAHVLVNLICCHSRTLSLSLSNVSYIALKSNCQVNQWCVFCLTVRFLFEYKHPIICVKLNA